MHGWMEACVGVLAWLQKESKVESLAQADKDAIAATRARLERMALREEGSAPEDQQDQLVTVVVQVRKPCATRHAPQAPFDAAHWKPAHPLDATPFPASCSVRAMPCHAMLASHTAALATCMRLPRSPALTF